MATSRRRAPAKAEVIDLRGKTGAEIAQLVLDGELSRKDAESFVADRAVRKLTREFDKLQS